MGCFVNDIFDVFDFCSRMRILCLFFDSLVDVCVWCVGIDARLSSLVDLITAWHKQQKMTQTKLIGVGIVAASSDGRLPLFHRILHVVMGIMG